MAKNTNRRKTFLKLPDKYTGWLGEDCHRQRGRRFIKDVEHRAHRRYVKAQITEETVLTGYCFIGYSLV